ncbi:MAG: DEAD/DEAH box helicase, partial [Oscillospiraceae bacterium]|nr:DEAD/DEAH box helicase [Oscillospiraceae bacterium]
GKWVEVDHEKLKALLAAYEKADEIAELGELTLADAMRMELGTDEVLGIKDDKIDVGVSNGEWLRSIKNRLKDFKEVDAVNLGDDFRGDLRNYQKVGFNWLYTMQNLNFGALLADDMGLGKTIQILALLEYLRENGNFKALLVIPASLIGNWENEIEKFAPKIKYTVLHSKNREITDDVNLFITTYGMASRIEELKDHKWNLIIVDEAQAIKNPTTKQTRAIKAIDGSFKIAMTGTPIENRLTDLWSLFDFLNKGLLGTSKEFSLFAKRLRENENYSKLRDVVNPFIMRRLKTDKSIISDLPDKLEIKVYTTLSKKQIVLYKTLVKEIESKLESAEGIERKGLILASIMKFKQICNHPDQYLGLSEYKPDLSGKFEMLSEVCGTIYEKRERVLVFTQFREMTQPIADYLETIFNQKGLILHGQTKISKRPEIVDQFNGEEYVPFMVLSLKAGGVGLNLTAANHVIHFDRWWNPAVENQATDRAFRIGQTKNVMVHKMITKGTIEEKIDAMIEDKLKLSGDIIEASGESWITEMSNKELMDLFSLK